MIAIPVPNRICIIPNIGSQVRWEAISNRSIAA